MMSLYMVPTPTLAIPLTERQKICHNEKPLWHIFIILILFIYFLRTAQHVSFLTPIGKTQ
jgi:hypothetical protein